MKKQKKIKFNIWEKLDFLTGKKIVICNSTEDKKMLKPYFPIGTKITVKAAGPRGAYYIIDMESLKKTARKLAPGFEIPKPETKSWNETSKLYDGRTKLNAVIRIEGATGSSNGGNKDGI